MRRLWIVLAFTLCLAPAVIMAQDNALTASEATLVTQTDPFGQQMFVAEGVITNDTEGAFTGVELNAVAYDAAGEEVGEGLGYLTNACGVALPDFVLQPSSEQFYAVTLDLYEQDVVVDRVEVTVSGDPTEAPPVAEAPLGKGVKLVDKREVVRVEWIDETNLRYGEGCRRELFNQWTWRDYNLNTGATENITHPKAEFMREALYIQTGLKYPMFLQHSMMSFDPNGRRMVYQTDLNSFYTAEADGSFKRLMFETLADRSLQGVSWLQDGTFIAYYYGSSNDPVTYFTGNVDGRIISGSPVDSVPSLITPGANPSGERIVIGLEVDGKTGYYVKLAAYDTITPLFDSPLPTNNWPAPLYERDADGKAYIYVAVPRDDRAVLVCYNVETQETFDLTELPLKLANDERGWWWLSPEYNSIALAAEGVNGGLWLIDLNATETCE